MKFEKDLNSSDRGKAYEHYILPRFCGGGRQNIFLILSPHLLEYQFSIS